MQLTALFAENIKSFTVNRQTDAVLTASESSKGLLEMGIPIELLCPISLLITVICVSFSRVSKMLTTQSLIAI